MGANGSSMSDANNVMQNMPILGSVFKIQNAIDGVATGTINGAGGILGNPTMLMVGGAVVLLILLK